MQSASADGNGGHSVLLQAIANPALRSAASLLLVSMEETGTISKEDAGLVTSFMGTCSHVGGVGFDVVGIRGGMEQQMEQPKSETGAAVKTESSGTGEAQRVAGSKRPRGTGTEQAGSRQEEGADYVNGAFEVREYVAGNMISTDSGGKTDGIEPIPVVVGNGHTSKRLYVSAEGGSGLDKPPQQQSDATAQIREDQWDPIPIKKPSSISSAHKHLPVNTNDAPFDAASGSSFAGQGDVNQPKQQVVASTVESIPSEYTHKQRLSIDLCSSFTCTTDNSFLPLNTKPIVGRESHTADLEVFDRFVDVLREAERPPSIGPFSDAFWAHVRKVLEPAVPVGFESLPSSDDISPKGPKDCAAFLGKIVATSPVNPIHPNIIAEASDLPLATVLNELFCATKIGLVDMQWAPLCDRCGSMACSKSKLEDLPNKTFCDGCMYENTVDCLEKIKTIFTLNREVFYVLMENFACAPSKASMAATCMFAVVPATSTGSGFRYSAGCGGDLMFCPALDPGRYRMHCPVAKTDNYLFVRREVAEDDEPVKLKLCVSDIVVKPGGQLKTFYAPHGIIHFDIYPDTNSLLVLWVQKDLDEHTLKYLPSEERPPFTNALEVIEFPTFALLFKKEMESMLMAAITQMRQRDGSRVKNGCIS